MSRLGFTLIEVIITLMIMSVLTIMSARTIQQAFRARTKIQNKLDQISQVKDTLRLIEKDINLAYHHLDLEKDLAEELSKTQKKSPQNQGQVQEQNQFNQNNLAQDQLGLGIPPPGSTNNNPFLKTKNRISPATHFIAKESEMHFVTMNTVRVIKDSPQADFGEVSYYVESCKFRPDKKFDSGKCLFRRVSPLVDREPTKGGASTQLLTDIVEFNLRFYSLLQRDWRKDWNSKEESGDANTKNRYPEAIEINLTVEPQIKDPKVEKKKKITIQMIVPIHFPNNKDPISNNPATGLLPGQNNIPQTGTQGGGAGGGGAGGLGGAGGGGGIGGGGGP